FRRVLFRSPPPPRPSRVPRRRVAGLPRCGEEQRAPAALLTTARALTETRGIGSEQGSSSCGGIPLHRAIGFSGSRGFTPKSVGPRAPPITHPLSTDGRPELASQHFEQFTANLDYARNMVVGGQALAGLRTVSVDFGALSAAHPEDLYRAAWSQAVSALDHWLHMEIRDHAVALVASTNRPLPDRLAKLRLPLEMVEEMAEDSKATVFGEFVDEEIRRDTYQRSKGITEGLRLVSELKADQIWAHIGAGRGMN